MFASSSFVPGSVTAGGRLVVVAFVPALLLAGVLWVGQASAGLPSNCERSGSTVTCTFSSTGAERFPVPAGVASVQVEAVGPSGGGGGQAAPGGAGAIARGTLSVTGGETLYVVVGGAGGRDGTAGFNGGGAGNGQAGGGGGASECAPLPCRTVSARTRVC